jgi:hypothetical protein
MSGHQVVVQWNRIWYELDDSSNIGEWQNSIGPDAEISLTSRLIGFKQFANLLKHLLHDSILPQIIVAPFDLFNISAVASVYLFIKGPTNCLNLAPSLARAVMTFGALTPDAIANCGSNLVI